MGDEFLIVPDIVLLPKPSGNTVDILPKNFRNNCMVFLARFLAKSYLFST